MGRFFGGELNENILKKDGGAVRTLRAERTVEDVRKVAIFILQ